MDYRLPYEELDRINLSTDDIGIDLWRRIADAQLARLQMGKPQLVEALAEIIHNNTSVPPFVEWDKLPHYAYESQPRIKARKVARQLLPLINTQVEEAVKLAKEQSHD